MEDDPVRDILRILDKAINIEKEVLYEITNNNSVPLDNFLNRCLSYIEKIEAIAVPVGYDSVEKGRARMAVENIYEGLQKYKGIERQDYDQRRSVDIDSLTEADEARTLESAVAYSGGGQGFAHVNWNAALLMSTHGKEDKMADNYWKPTSTKPVRKVDPSEYDGIMAEHEANRKQTYAEWEKEMAKQKKEVLSEVQRVQ